MSLVEISRGQKQKPLRVAVVGVGMMGQHHLRIYNMMSGIELVAAVDIDENRAKHAAKQYGCHAFTAVEDLVGKVDAVSLAVPSQLHAEIGCFLLSNNIHCLIEKPLAISEEECNSLIEIADRKGMVLLVGHTEHFNPAVQQISRILAEGHTIHAIDVHRMGASSKRVMDVDVVMDLMIHDLEIVTTLLPQTITRISAEGVGKSSLSTWNYASALLSFAGGALASLTASRITNRKVRTLSITSDKAYMLLDYSAQELLIYHEPKNHDHYVPDLMMERVLIRPVEPLLLELQNFVQSVRTEVALGVDGRQALKALRLVWEIQACMMQKSLEFPKQIRTTRSIS